MGANKRVTDAELLAALDAYGWNITAAAEYLGLDRSSIYARLQDPAPGPLADAVAQRRSSSRTSRLSGLRGVLGMSGIERGVGPKRTVVGNRVAVFPTAGDALNFLGVSQASHAHGFEPAAPPRVRLSEQQLAEFEEFRVRASGILGQSISTASFFGQFWRTFRPWAERVIEEMREAEERQRIETGENGGQE